MIFDNEDAQAFARLVRNLRLIFSHLNQPGRKCVRELPRRPPEDRRFYILFATDLSGRGDQR
jgi:hypothetical protein